MWINSLGIDGVFVNALFNDIKTGIILLKVLDRVQPGCVDWKRVEKNPNTKLKAISNCNLVITIGKALGFKLIGISGTDLFD